MGKQNQTHDVLRVSHSTCQEESKFWKQLACFQKEILMRLKEKECASLIRKFGRALTMGSCKPAQKMLLFLGVGLICSETWKVGITWIIPAQCSWVSVRESILVDTLLSLEGNFSGPVFTLVFQFFQLVICQSELNWGFCGLCKATWFQNRKYPTNLLLSLCQGFSSSSGAEQWWNILELGKAERAWKDPFAYRHTPRNSSTK